MKLILILLSCFAMAAYGAESAYKILPLPIEFDAKRIQLTKDYILSHYGIRTDSIDIVPRMIVLHWTTQKSLLQSFNTFNHSEFIGQERDELPDKLNVSSHFLVDRDGTIYQLMPETKMARHVIGLNYAAIGIENVGGVNDEDDLTEAQVKANAFLVCYLKRKYPEIYYLIGHKDYLQFKNSVLWLEKDTRYYNTKRDPGEGFMRRVVARLQCQVHLKMAPQ